MINWICHGNAIKPCAACPDCGAKQTILECSLCGQDFAETALSRKYAPVCLDCVGAQARAKVYAEKPYTLLYDNGTGHYDCASVHATLDAAMEAAKTGWQNTYQIVTDDLDCQNVIWSVIWRP